MEGAGGESPAPLLAAEFAALMVRFQNFESYPCIAIACSGGGDSMALALLADRWVRDRGGVATALIVDHRLRPESTGEAAQVAAWLAGRNIDHVVLTREGASPQGDIEAQARAARYRLFEAWCSANGCLHLLTGHHREDQAETFLMRLARGSGLDGLAAMSPESTRAQFRLLRPLLDIPQARLKATLAAAGQGFIDDPMNRDRAFLRARLRASRAALAEEGLSAERLSATAARLARARAALETVVAELLASAVTIDPRGFAILDSARLATAPAEIGLRALASLIACMGGAEYPPRLDRIERLHAELPLGDTGGRTLGGCLLQRKPDGVLVCREAEALAGPIAALPGQTVRWDGRFLLTLPEAAPAGLSVGALGIAAPEVKDALPAVVRATLPALYDSQGLVAVPHLGWRREKVNAALSSPEMVVFRPLNSLARAGLTVV
jgi:tRNA(Ile)-lysidine synthase